VIGLPWWVWVLTSVVLTGIAVLIYGIRRTEKKN
jgi:hypothetical protein